MIWLQPIAWIGVVAIALPVLIHLLGLGRARRLPFPTLQFLQSTRLLPTRRTRLHDPWLLLVRACIVLAAVAALAQPLWQTSARRANFGSSLARVVVLDTSRSAIRAAARSGWSADSARALAAQLVSEANAAVLLPTVHPAAAVAGAVAWLRLQPQRQELVIVSDFQRGVIDDAVWRAIPTDVGVRLLRVGAAPSVAVDTSALAFAIAHSTQSDVSVRTSFENDDARLQTRATWRRESATDAPRAGGTRVSLLSDKTPDPLTAGMLSAASRLSVRLVDSAWRAASGADANARAPEIAVVTRDHPARAALLDTASEIASPWMADVLARVSGSSLLADVVASAVPLDSGANAETGEANLKLVPIARNSSGAVIVSATAVSREQQETLLLLINSAPDYPTTTALLAAAQQAVDATLNAGPFDLTDASVLESDALAIADSTLTRWQREPAVDGSATAARRASPLEGPSDARWLWVLVLFLLGVETVLRRRMYATASPLADDTGLAARAAPVQTART